MKKTTNEHHKFMDDMDEINREDASGNISVDFYDDDQQVDSDEIDFDEEIESSDDGQTGYDDDTADSSESYRSCNCLPSCTSIHYDAEISQTELNLLQYYKDTNMHEKLHDE